MAKTAKNPSTGRTRKPNPETRRQMIAEAAYYRAERRGFVSDDTVQDWLEAEKEIDRGM